MGSITECSRYPNLVFWIHKKVTLIHVFYINAVAESQVSDRICGYRGKQCLVKIFVERGHPRLQRLPVS